MGPSQSRLRRAGVIAVDETGRSPGMTGRRPGSGRPGCVHSGERTLAQTSVPSPLRVGGEATPDADVDRAGRDALRLAQLIAQLSTQQRAALRQWLLDQLRADE